MRRTALVPGYISMAALLLMSAQGCIADGVATSDYVDDDASDASVEYVDEKASASELATEELVRRVVALPDKTLVVFDFDDTLRDHVDGQSSRWATYAKSAINHLKQQKVLISVCSRNKNSNGALNKALRSLDSEVFNDAFFKSPAFQTDTGLDKSDDIRQIMSFFGIKRDNQVVFYDDDPKNMVLVDAATDVLSVMVYANGIDREEFRDGLSRRLSESSGGGAQGSCSGKCSSSCRCTEGQGDCDSNADCASGLICPPDGDGSEVCMRPSTSCSDRCSSSCPCTEGKGDCDSNADCASGLVCPPDGPGSELCRKP